MFYAARVARTPYLIPAGPDSLNVSVYPGLVDAGELVTINASADDTRYNESNGNEPSQNISAAQFYLVSPWIIGAFQRPMSAADGNFDQQIEAVTAIADTAGLAGGRHIVYVRSRDDAGSWGAFSAAFLWIRGGPEGSVQGFVTESGTGAGIEATISVDNLGTEVTSNPADGSFDLPLPPGTWTLRASSPYHTGQTVGSIVVTQDATVLQNFVLELIDGDNDGVADALDCAASDPSLWSAPGPASGLRLTDSATDNIIWDAPSQPGGTNGPRYDVLRTTNSTDFNLATCLASDLATTSATESEAPPLQSLYRYLIRAENACGSTLGVDSTGSARSGTACP